MWDLSARERMIWTRVAICYGLLFVSITVAVVFIAALFVEIGLAGTSFAGPPKPKTIDLGLPVPHARIGGLFAADPDRDVRPDFVITGIGFVSAFSNGGAPLWAVNADIPVTGTAETDGLSGLHAPGPQGPT